MSPVLEVEGLCKSYGGVRAVDGVSFSVPAGQVRALIGPNGAGKTTCFQLISGFLPPDGGRVRFRGADITGRSPQQIVRLGLARTFQHCAVFSSMTVRENVQMALLAADRGGFAPWGSFARRNRERARELLVLVGLADHDDQPAHNLPFADLKRLEVAIALAHKPALLLLDEPTAGMALGERFALMELLLDLRRRLGVALLFTEHDLEVVFRFAEWVMVMDRGRLVAEGPPAAVRTDPTVRDVYLGDAPTSLPARG